MTSRAATLALAEGMAVFAQVKAVALAPARNRSGS
jgi:hypothetical protein